MQSGKRATESVKEAAAGIAASAQAGMEKTKATVQEKVEKATARTPAEKAAAEAKKQEKVREAEIVKQEAMWRHEEPGVVAGHPIGGQGIEGVTESRPIGRATGTGRPSAAHNPFVGSEEPVARGTGDHDT
ncbi:11 kDa late embryogenesis abundant protein-like [Zingiber officinale]|uniref:11 kDa late embryogenesis abundant protein-like n=1 Tax=Zingiber officinale TaxID=94328 RepID=UPI001C4BD607|nr:11 kDa late embryogenesis abundant protein-like [Zingiber officinale]